MPIGINIILENGIIKFDDSNRRIKHVKGKSLLELPIDYTVIDIETTGLSPEYDEIIEISALKFRNDTLIDKYTTLVCPSDIDMVDEYITDLTGITQNMLKGEPLIVDVLPKLITFVGDDILIAHNANFDINFICEYVESELNTVFINDFVDTLRLARRAIHELSSHKLTKVAKYFGIDTEGNHRAEKDCIITQMCYLKIKEILRNSPEKLILKSELDLKSLSATVENIDIDNPFYGKNCVFTGKLDKMIRADAAQLIVNLGAIAENNITKKTNYLILGNYDYMNSIKNGKSNKQKKAEKLILSGADLQIIPEDVFYQMINEYQKVK